jgi:hypothetical protein
VDEKLLKRLIEKAGFDVWNWWIKLPYSHIVDYFYNEQEGSSLGSDERLIKALVDNGMWKLLIFNHDFAKALWGETYGYRMSWYHVPRTQNMEVETLNLNSWNYKLARLIILSDEELLKELERSVG